MANPFPPLDGHPSFKKSKGGLKSPPPECGPALEAGYLVREPADEMPSSSPSCELKVRGPKLHDLGKKQAMAVNAADDEK